MSRWRARDPAKVPLGPLAKEVLAELSKFNRLSMVVMLRLDTRLLVRVREPKGARNFYLYSDDSRRYGLGFFEQQLSRKSFAQFAKT